MLLSVVIPTYNRPLLLREAVQSIAQQTYHNYEVIIIDDGSVPPVSEASLRDILVNMKVYKHDFAQGIAKAKNAGIKIARGEIILLLDDDDLLTPDALEIIHGAYCQHPEIDCLFMGVEPFGPYADGPARNREKAVNSIVERTKPTELSELYFFENNLFDALLRSVPIDFQRPAARRGTWNVVGGFDENSLFSESSWAIRASAFCKIALIKKPVSRWRIHDNNFGWPSGLNEEQIAIRNSDNGICMAENLLFEFSTKEKNIHFQRQKIKKYLSFTYFSRAYHYRFQEKLTGLKFLYNSFRLSPTIKHLRLVIIYLLPSKLIKRFSNYPKIEMSAQKSK